MRAGNTTSWRELGTLFGVGTAAGLSDEQLLERFVDRRTEAAEAAVAAEAAFAAIVLRHGPMVLSVCRRLLVDVRDAEDAFQATFLVLARRAGSLKDGDRLGGWLRRVATRVAVRARAEACRRRRREVAIESEPFADPAPEQQRAELRDVLADELRRLPEKYRAAIELCHLEGLSVREAGVRLGRPAGTVCVHLSRGRGLLKSRLARRGLAPAAVLASGASGASADVPARLLNATARAAARGAAFTSPHVLSLSRGVLKTMLIAKFKWAAPLVVAVGIGVVGSSGHPSRAAADDPEPQQQTASPWDKVENDIEELARTGIRQRRAGERGAALETSQRLAERVRAWQIMLEREKGQAREDFKKQARDFLLSAQKLINDGKLDEAMRMIEEARKLDVKWGTYDFTPDKAAAHLNWAATLNNAHSLYGAVMAANPGEHQDLKKLLESRTQAEAVDLKKLLESRPKAEAVDLKTYYDAVLQNGAASSQERRLQAVEEKLDRLLNAMEKADAPRGNQQPQPRPKGYKP
jgi:RNA polymerase sigma factor (sigma-70 family)